MNLILRITGRTPKGASVQLDPNGPIYQHAQQMGFVDPDKMSDAQLQEVVLDLAGALPPVPVSPFSLPASDDEAKRRAARRADLSTAIDLATEVGAAMKRTFAAFQAANDARFQRIVANLHALIPAPPDTAGDTEYARLERLLAQLHLYLAAITPGWTGNIGQQNHESKEALLARLKMAYPDADAAVNPT